jgi:hypothetical protein
MHRRPGATPERALRHAQATTSKLATSVVGGTNRTNRGSLRMSVHRVRRTSRLGTQVVRINADLVHFQFAPSDPESSIGGVDPIGAKVAAQANIRNASMSKGRFIAVLLFAVFAD